jgi:hypothetical protein
MFARKIPDAAVGAADAVPETEVEAIIPSVQFMVSLMMARSDEPLPQWTPPHERRKHFPPHVVGDPHNRHDREHQPKCADMNWNHEDQ